MPLRRRIWLLLPALVILTLLANQPAWHGGLLRRLAVPGRRGARRSRSGTSRRRCASDRTSTKRARTWRGRAPDRRRRRARDENSTESRRTRRRAETRGEDSDAVGEDPPAPAVRPTFCPVRIRKHKQRWLIRCLCLWILAGHDAQSASGGSDDRVFPCGPVFPVSPCCSRPVISGTLRSRAGSRTKRNAAQVARPARRSILRTIG
jgi:hypothetical protein